nr:unnamed protein product [Callosobruchus analis]
MFGKPFVKYDCKVCHKHYESLPGLQRHMYSQHNDKGDDWSVICDICGKKISSKEKLKYHMRTHSGYRPFQCAKCPKRFPKKDQLKEHERVHTGEKPFMCMYCGKKFGHRAPYRYHIKTHTGERPHNCPFVERVSFRRRPRKDT